MGMRLACSTHAQYHAARARENDVWGLKEGNNWPVTEVLRHTCMHTYRDVSVELTEFLLGAKRAELAMGTNCCLKCELQFNL